MPTLDLPALLKEIGRGARGARDLTREQARLLFGAMLDGEVDDLQLGAIAIALRIKGESVEEMLGFADAMQARCAPLQAHGPLLLLPAVNGARKLLNLMPLLALQLAADGVAVLIHGRYDFGGARQDPFALLAALGQPAADSLVEAETRLAAQQLAVLPTALLCPGLDRLMALRPRLGLRNSAHTLVKLLDPAPGRSLRVVAVTHGEVLERLGDLLPGASAHALLLKGCEGEAYPHPRRPPSLRAWSAGQALELPAGDAEDIALLDSSGDIQGDTAQLQALLAAGPSSWPARLREMRDAVHMLIRNI